MTYEMRKEVFSWIKTIVFAVLAAVLINSFVIVNARIPTGSMEDTIIPKDRVLAFRLAYISGEPQRGDIIVFRYPDDESELFVKRVIGLPGEKLEIIAGKVYINDSDKPLTDDFVKINPDGQVDVLSFGPCEIPEGAYFVMGDNRMNSLDSRKWENKFVYKEKILGKVFIKYFPRVELIRSIEM